MCLLFFLLALFFFSRAMVRIGHLAVKVIVVRTAPLHAKIVNWVAFVFELIERHRLSLPCVG